MSDNETANLINETMNAIETTPKTKKVAKKAKKAETAVVPVATETAKDFAEPSTPSTPALESTPAIESEEVKALKARIVELEAEIKVLKESKSRGKTDNSPDYEEGIHMRMLNGEKTKMKYVFPYQADGGKSLISQMVVGQKVYGVSCTQKNNSKATCKNCDFNLTWLSKNTVKDNTTGTVYAHKEGKFAVVVGETATNVRMMVLA